MLAALAGCREHADRSGPIRFAIDSSDTPTGDKTRLAVLGIDRSNLRALRDSAWPPARWNALLHVSVSGQDSIAVQGKYTANDSALEFHPAYFFDHERPYAVRFDPRKLPNGRPDSVIHAVFTVQSSAGSTRATIERILPTTDTVPENVLRMYVEFSQPMSREPGTFFIHLIDDHGKEVTHAFLPLDADFWNPAHTRYTLFFDPGRVKRGILPNEQLGRAIRAGRVYSIVVDSAWRDANGLPLAHSYTREFHVSPPVVAPIAPNAWIIRPPKPGGRDPLVVRFPRPLDHGLLRRAVGVETKRGKSVAGEVEIEQRETEWRFTPREAWSAGDYTLVVLSILEDVAGNRVGRPFEVDMFERVDSTAAPERYTRPFTIR